MWLPLLLRRDVDYEAEEEQQQQGWGRAVDPFDVHRWAQPAAAAAAAAT